MTRKSLVITVLTVASITNVVLIFHTINLPSGRVTSLSSSADNKQISSFEVSDVRLDLGDQELAALRSLNHNLTEQLELQKSLVSFLLQEIINNHNFSYIHNPLETCSSGNIEVLFVIPSAPANFEYRDKVRNGSRGSYTQDFNNHAKLLFFLGDPEFNASNETDKNVQLKINEEALKYKDIVQERFEDCYKNMRLKAVSMLKWASTYCELAQYVIRTDDDVQVNPNRLVAALHRKSLVHSDFILGSIVSKWEPIRDKKNKYFLSEEEYPYSTLPPFVLGGLLGYPISTVKLLYQAALRTKPLWLDDVFITAICASKVHVPLVDDPDFSFKHWAW
ncbi:hypothetical protein BsWGS_08783 [Bradybaena similaris]